MQVVGTGNDGSKTDATFEALQKEIRMMREDRSVLQTSIRNEPSSSAVFELKYLKLKSKMESRFEKERQESL